MRTWVHQRLAVDAELANLLEEGTDNADAHVFASRSLENTPEHKPFVVHAMGNDTSERLGSGSKAHRQYLTIYVHDEGEDYTRIDEVLARIIELFDDAPSSPEFGVLTAHYLETSQDFEDDQMGTIVKYARFQLIGA